MIKHHLKIELHEKSIVSEIEIGAGLLAGLGEFARKKLDPQARKIVIISNAKVFGLYGEAAQKSLAQQGYEVFKWLMKDGERYKNLRSLESALQYFSVVNLTRTDAVVALGGGVVGDLAGFAAAVFQRGIPFLQIPTTLLAMVDSSVGGKTAVNSAFGKNMIGAFYQPNGVLIDVELLQTLPRRELAAGFCEMIKHGAISGDDLFTQTYEFLQKFPIDKFSRYFKAKNADLFTADLQNLIAAQVAFKALIVGGDEHEDPHRDDPQSRKILNFGHTVAHALEKNTDYRRFKHGEAVGYGMLVAIEISKKLVKQDKTKLNLIGEAIRLVGKLPNVADLNTDEIIKAFAFDKKVAGDSLKWILLEEIGRVRIVTSREIPAPLIREAIEKVFAGKT